MSLRPWKDGVIRILKRVSQEIVDMLNITGFTLCHNCSATAISDNEFQKSQKCDRNFAR